ncbi:hypothetical protein M5K25_000296 [Dendrobium thyrsiflorum]|uniref:Uncharacterized protein n=1 Tax=Dendrobium thyrsiflorum TaxID=117978 RepID=A0ABD0VV85_DENTH
MQAREALSIAFSLWVSLARLVALWKSPSLLWVGRTWQTVRLTLKMLGNATIRVLCEEVLKVAIISCCWFDSCGLLHHFPAFLKSTPHPWTWLKLAPLLICWNCKGWKPKETREKSEIALTSSTTSRSSVGPPNEARSYAGPPPNISIDLFDDDELNIDEADLSKIEINKDFAKRFEYNKKHEALQKCRELKKRGIITDSDESSDESSDDEEVKDDFQFYDALVKVKKNDPTIMQMDAKLFSSSSEDEEEEAEEKKSKTTKKVKPLYLKDVMARQLMEEGTKFEEEPLQKNPKVEGLKDFLQAEKEAFGSDDDHDVIIEQKEGARKDIDNDEEVKRIHKVDEFYGEDGDLNEDKMFLKNYCLNTMWVEDDKRTCDDIGVS